MNARSPVPPIPLSRSIEIWQELRTTLIETYGLAEDDPALLDTLDGEADLADRFRLLLRSGREDEAQAKGLATYIEELKARQSRLKTRAEGKRRTVSQGMSEVGLKRLDAPDLTATLHNGRPSAIVTDPDALPDQLCRIKREPDKVAIREALEAGETVPGAILGNKPQVLTVYTK
jgi:hypothetical protein